MNQQSRSAAASKRLHRRQRQAEALDLHVMGLTYRQIAKRMKISVSTAHAYVNDALKEITRPRAEEVLTLHLERYRQLLLAIMPKALLGRPAEIDRALTIMARVERLHGVESPREKDATAETANMLDQLLANSLKQVEGTPFDPTTTGSE